MKWMGCCGCPVIGFDGSMFETGDIPSCCDGMSPIFNLINDVSRLSECTVVFAGGYGETNCHPYIRFADSDWPAILTYIQNGGRFFQVSDNSSCETIFPGSLKRVNDFLAAIGSTIRVNTYDLGRVGGFGVPDPSKLEPGVANIAQPPNNDFHQVRFTSVTGGTSVWVVPDASFTFQPVNPFFAVVVTVEKIGNGYLFVAGDTNLYGCEFWKRLWEYPDASII